jgi:hypothetical protein
VLVGGVTFRSGVCKVCQREMDLAVTCNAHGAFLPFGNEPRGTLGNRCPRCNVQRGAMHHPGCPIERKLPAAAHHRVPPRWQRDHRLRYLPPMPTHQAQTIHAAWLTYGREELDLSNETLRSVCPDAETVRTIAWELTGREGDYTTADARRILDRIERNLSRTAVRWSVETHGDAITIRMNRTAKDDNRTAVQVVLDLGDAAYRAWRTERIAILAAEGATATEIATRLDVSPVTVRRAVPKSAHSRSEMSTFEANLSVKRRAA